ncbi:rhodanese-like domain-containing protein [Salmonirosea aquatica]|uniref:Rhodanese-like domain-containing protein n=1 Tax=Salmonirosea aquatica TaxID=2654236 RepID=A0A7C9BGY0_9BACT|nr:rhodanese-like domain-containing protein [Cytophagaceae bacterium SJW1-29]
MRNLLKSLFGGTNTNDLKEKVAAGAIIVDVRTPGEFAGGHVPNAKNIPLDALSAKMSQIQSWDKPVVVCCASGMRSSRAKSLLAAKGVEVYDAGPWKNLA